MKKVSVIIPCYNHGNYIEETLSYVFASTYQNIEAVIVNDGSTDEYTNKLLPTLASDKIKVITTENQGTAGACKVAVENSTGDYILPLGSDDKFDPTYIEKAVQILDTKPEVGLVYCDAEYFGAKTGPWVLPDFSIDVMKKGNCIFCCALYRKSDYDKTEGYHVDMRNWEDYDLWLSLLELGIQVYKIPEVLFYYRITGISKTDAVKQDPDRINKLMTQIQSHHKQFFNISVSKSVSKTTRTKEVYF